MQTHRGATVVTGGDDRDGDARESRDGDRRDGRDGDPHIKGATITDSEADGQTSWSGPEGTANPSRPWLPAYRVGLLARKREKYDLQDYRDYVEFLNWLNTRPSGLKRRQLVEPDISARTFIFTRQIHQWDALMAMYSSQRLKQK